MSPFKKITTQTNTRLKLVITALVVLSICFISSTTNAQSKGSIQDQVTAGAKAIALPIGYTPTGTDFNQYTLVGKILVITNILIGFAGVLVFGLAFYAGYVWMMARGNEGENEKSKTIIREVIIGFIILLSARILTEVIITEFSAALIQK